MNKDKGKVFYIGNFDFPKGNAAGIRVLNNGYLLRELGYDVSFIGLSTSAPLINKFESEFNIYDGFNYLALNYPKVIKEWFFFTEKLDKVKKELIRNKPLFVIMYGSLSNSFFSRSLIKWCKLNDIKVFSDCVDWLHISSDSFLFKTFKTIDTYLQKRIFNTSCDGIISVSSHLSDFYNNLGVSTVLIPPLNSSVRADDILDFESKPLKSNAISLFYAGYPFAINVKKPNSDLFKDRLDLVLDYLDKLNEFDFVFNIYGMTKEDYLKVVFRHELLLGRLSGKVIFHGKVDNDLINKALKTADYIVLLRHSNRMTNFGFPSKISEAMGFAVPAITTRTSDLERYIQDGKNGYFVNIDDPSLAYQKFKEIFEKHTDLHPLISTSCMRHNPFHYSHYSKVFNDFLIKNLK